ncbi:MAG: hypothetical protein JO107_10615 [Hyphomicrobiales bacterium]|nr:hypothetical protein [Hyphomicrobiales bacterium]MBV8663543.1 hypothetical protein [Hyphomicrobiales bacterium]
MFDFDVGKLLIFGIVALAVIPPKDLPRVMRTVGQTVAKMRRMAAEFQGQFMEAMKEAELESVKQELESVKKELSAVEQAAKVNAAFDPAMAMRQEMTSAVEGSKQIGVSEVALDAVGPVANEIEAAPAGAAPEASTDAHSNAVHAHAPAHGEEAVVRGAAE